MILSRFRLMTVLVALVALSGLAWLAAAPVAAADTSAQVDALRAHLARTYPDIDVDAVRPSPLDGLFEVVSGTQVLYLSADGRYLLRGSLVDLESGTNLTSERRGGLIHQAIEAIGEDRMLIFEPAEGPAKYEITVFTDTSCPYCQRLHADLLHIIQRYPVRVRYLFFPRAGLDSAAADIMRDVWCAPDPQAAITAAKRGQPVPAHDADCETPIADDYALGRRIGVHGTPFLVIGDDGPTVPGYRPPAQLLALMGIKS